MKQVRIFIAFITLICIVVVFVVAGLQMLINPNRLKPIIVDEFKTNTGYDINIEGDMRWSFYPLFSIKIDRITLSKPLQKTPMLILDEVNLGTPLGKFVFRTKNLSGYIDVKHLNVMGLDANNASFRFIFDDDGTLTLSPIYANFYGGTLHGKLMGHDLYADPKWHSKMELKDVQIDSLLTDLKATHVVKLKGLADLHWEIRSQGKTEDELLQHLHGESIFYITKGVILGIDLNQLLQSAEAIIKREPLPQPNPGEQNTHFDVLQGSASLQNGIATLQKTTLNAATFKAVSSGSIDMYRQTLDLKLQIIPLANQDNISWSIPVIIKGQLQQPQVSLDMDEVNKMMVKIGIEKLKDKANEKLEEVLPSGTKIFIEKLLGH